MSGFKGTFSPSIDSKGRMPVPAKLRRSLRPEANDMFVATRGLDQCVYLYPADVWETLEEGFAKLNTFQEEAREFVRDVYRWADDVTLDGQGRISISSALMELAELEAGGKATVLGMRDHIEIWNQDVLDAHESRDRPSYSENAARVMSGTNDIQSNLN